MIPPAGDVEFPWNWVQTPQRQFIVYANRGRETGSDVMLLPVQGGRPRPLLNLRFDETGARAQFRTTHRSRR
jgi:hypothetical protein